MKTKDKKTILSFTLLLCLITYITICFSFLLEKIPGYADAITSAVMMLITALSIAFLGYHKDKNTHLKKEILKIVIFLVSLYFVILYGLGTVFGFVKNGYSLRPIMIINNTLAPIIVVISSEIFRYVMVSNNKEKSFSSKIIIALTVITLVIVESSRFVSLDDFTSARSIFYAVSSVILPSIMKNLTLTYLTYHVGPKSSLIYRIVLDLYIYLLPIFPDLDDFVSSMLDIALPFLVYLYTSRVIKDDSGEKEFIYTNNTKVFSISDGIFIAFTVLLIGLISCKFPYYLIGIATGSMEPNINVGDGVLVHKVDEADDFKIGDVLVYSDDRGRKIVHRLKEIVTEEDGQVIYKTKGDANGSEDAIDLTLENIDGKVIVKIPFIGYPSLWFSSLLNNG